MAVLRWVRLNSPEIMQIWVNSARAAEGVGPYSGTLYLRRSALDWLTDLTDFSITGVKKDLKRKG